MSMISEIILKPGDPQVQRMCPFVDAGFDIGEEVRAKTRPLKE